MVRKDKLLYSEYYQGKKIWFRRKNGLVNAIIPNIHRTTGRTKKEAFDKIKIYMRANPNG